MPMIHRMRSQLKPLFDRQHLAILLDSGPRQPMTVKSVNVWQATADGNWER